MSGVGERRCRCWLLARADGVVLGFTDHDGDLSFDGVVFRARSGMTARALVQSSGLAVDNTEAAGALSDLALTEADLAAGRWDGARVRIWELDWAAPEGRELVFAGRLGETERSGQAFRAELRGLSEALSAPRGRVIQQVCGAVLGDGACRADLDQPGYRLEREVVALAGEGTELDLGLMPGVDPGWFAHGRLRVLDGAAVGLSGVVRTDRPGVAGARVLKLWARVAGLAPGDRVLVEPGCDKRLETCRTKFNNILNFRGFPDVPGEDWLVAVPREGGAHDGSSRRG
jgi:uncharacterized phage protein (TIGR02218 family)